MLSSMARLSFVGIFIGAALLPAAWCPGEEGGTRPKHVLMIAVDDLNDWTGHLGGHPQAQTPNIDRLVSRGVTFTNAHCAAPACNPSRTALMSGVRPWESGIYVNGQSAAPFLSDTVTINRHFLASGYRTVGGGKIYHGFGSEGREDTWTEWIGNPGTTGKMPTNINGLNKAHFDWGPLSIATEAMGDAKLTDWAIEELQSASESTPLFLSVGYVKPHLPWYVPQEYFDRFPLSEVQLPAVLPDDLADIPSAGVKMAKPNGDHAAVVSKEQWKHAVRGYLATIAFLDDQVGRLLAALESSEIADDTIVIWWTDHGWHLGEKQHWRKFALWRDATRTSFAIAAPGVTKPGTVCDAPVDYMSVYPTLCELTGLPIPKHVRGPSLMPLLQDPDSNWDHRAICTHGRGNHAVYDQRWHLIRYADGSQELYDLENDPNEWKNLANEPGHSAKIQQLLAALPDIDAEVKPRPNQKRPGAKRARNRR